MKTILSIHPAIGIARVGNSELKDSNGNPLPESYFIGPETSGFGFEPKQTSNDLNATRYRDAQLMLRRQGVRFRIYERKIDDFGNIVDTREITSDDAMITWTVKIANKKAAAERFPPYNTDWHSTRGGQDLGKNRNHNEQNRLKLMVTPNATDISLGQNTKELVGKFMGEDVKLGDILTDKKGRLIFLGGHGKYYDPNNVGLNEPNLGRHQLYNYDQISDDTSDGWITATVQFNNNHIIKVDGAAQRARVITAPPNFAPLVQSAITLYDVIYQANLAHRPDLAIPNSVSFTRDIYPFLRRIVSLKYVSEEARWGHGDNKRGDFMKKAIFKTLKSNAKTHRQARQRLVDILTKLGASNDEIKMPKLYGGVNPHNPTQGPDLQTQNDLTRLDRFGIPLIVTDYQRKVLNLWAKGKFLADWPGTPPRYEPLCRLNVKDQPDALDRAGLEDCSGGSFHPGIEGPYLMARPDTYVAWFRVGSSFSPGDITKGMAVPWHRDFKACTEYWWPAQRPNSVPVGNGDYQDWARNWDWSSLEKVFKLGIVSDDSNGVIQERERNLK